MRWTAPIRVDGGGRTTGRGGGVDGPGGRRRMGRVKKQERRRHKQNRGWEARERMRVPPPPPPKILRMAPEGPPAGLDVYIYIYIRPASESALRLPRFKTTESGAYFDRIRRIRGADSADSGTICPDSRIAAIQICVAFLFRTSSALNRKPNVVGTSDL